MYLALIVNIVLENFLALIYFFKGNYYSAYTNFKNAYHQLLNDNKSNLNPSLLNEVNIAKWLAYSGLILLFCENGRIDLSQLQNLKPEQVNDKEENSLLFSCCTNRKTRQDVNSLLKPDNDIFNNYKIDSKSTAKEIMRLLNTYANKGKFLIEI